MQIVEISQFHIVDAFKDHRVISVETYVGNLRKKVHNLSGNYK